MLLECCQSRGNLPVTESTEDFGPDINPVTCKAIQSESSILFVKEKAVKIGSNFEKHQHQIHECVASHCSINCKSI